ncbi:1-acyl-sn-glycerol-3-phosphate acyltransferase [Sanguibacteroides justesenii]|uniref:Phospholipid/glycerol acyltransferase domain-containing protein n=1 Tax=Sanguibacteroides justesenii TaxID=1547597 RepID=A0AB34R7R5_9PORP|nr:1-acyl-sn-glycerol-3-phosphate acyltransferase [Sanguibacteroides justesenii]KIO47261.1 hypothetical protein IE90_01310 [Sanguibacteroides justesenii]
MVRVFAAIYRYLLALRYRVKLEGTELLTSSSTKLFLPNHQATVDPQLIFVHLYKYTKASPLVTEVYCKVWILKPIFRLMGVVSVPDLEKSRKGIEVVANLYKNVLEALAHGHSMLIYPAGQLAGQGYERIYNKQSAWQVCRQLPEDTRIIGVRIRGLWGSMWSKAWNGESPNFLWTYLKGIFYVLANGLFFLPRRDVTISFYDITDAGCGRAAVSRQEFNRYLESFYNAEGPEPVLFLKHFFYSPALKRKLPEHIKGADPQKYDGISE